MVRWVCLPFRHLFSYKDVLYNSGKMEREQNNISEAGVKECVLLVRLGWAEKAENAIEPPKSGSRLLSTFFVVSKLHVIAKLSSFKNNVKISKIRGQN